MKKGGSSSMVKRRSIMAAPMATVRSRPSADSHLNTRMIVSVVVMLLKNNPQTNQDGARTPYHGRVKSWA